MCIKYAFSVCVNCEHLYVLLLVQETMANAMVCTVHGLVTGIIAGVRIMSVQIICTSIFGVYEIKVFDKKNSVGFCCI